MSPIRPRTLQDVAHTVSSLEEFGFNLRDWQHEIQRGGVHSRTEFARRIAEEPEPLAARFLGGDIADAYLAAYAEWLADQARLERPPWCNDSSRVARNPWFSAPTRAWLLVHSPASFRQRNLFTVPEPVFTPKPGRPRKSTEHKRERARARQKAYRDRIRTLVNQARSNQDPAHGRPLKGMVPKPTKALTLEDMEDSIGAGSAS